MAMKTLPHKAGSQFRPFVNVPVEITFDGSTVLTSKVRDEADLDTPGEGFSEDLTIGALDIPGRRFQVTSPADWSDYSQLYWDFQFDNSATTPGDIITSPTIVILVEREIT